MPSQIPLETRHYPNDFVVHVTNLGTLAAANVLLWYFDRDVVLDEVMLTLPDNISNANPGINVKLLKLSNGGLPNFGTPVAGQTDVTSAFNLLTGATYPLQVTWDKLVQGDVTQGFVATDSTERGNIIKAGSYLWLCASAAATGVTGPASILLRWRSQF
mgnify:CR=1 FL=1